MLYASKQHANVTTFNCAGGDGQPPIGHQDSLAAQSEPQHPLQNRGFFGWAASATLLMVGVTGPIPIATKNLMAHLRRANTQY